MTTSPRALGRVLLALALATFPAACSSAASSVTTLTVLTPWTSTEEAAAFQAIVDGFKAENPGIDVEIQKDRAAGNILQTDVQNGDPPDLAVLPNPGALVTYAAKGALRPIGSALSAQLENDYGPQWTSLLKAGTSSFYAVAVKASVKSLITYEPKRINAFGDGPVPTDWTHLLAFDASISRTGATPWCLALSDPPNSGWPGTDWIEDILLHQSGAAAYESWADGRLPWTSSQVESAWQTWGQVIAQLGPNRGGVLTAMLARVGDVNASIFASSPTCFLYHGAPTVDPQGAAYDFITFPALNPSTAQTYEVSGDLMGMFKASPQAEKLMAFLAAGGAQSIWPSKTPDLAFSPNKGVSAQFGSVYAAHPTAKRIDDLLTSPTATLCFDASDLMPTVMENAFYRGVLEYMQDPNRLKTILSQLDAVRQGAYTTAYPSFGCGSGH